jgi:hypothetical protein
MAREPSDGGRAIEPARTVRRLHWRLVFLGLGYLGLAYVSLLLQSDIQLVVRFFLGLDFKEFYDAAHVYLRGGNPYEIARFVTPPASLLPNLVLAPFHFETARDLWCLASVAMLGAGMILVARAAGHRGADLGLSVAFLFASFPAQMLIERGNIDALVFLLLALALVARPAWFAGAAWALAALTKVYPLLLAPVVWRERGYRALLAAGLVAAVVTAAFWQPTVDYLPRLAMRAAEERFRENISPVAYFGHGFHAYALAYLVLNLWLDHRLIARGAPPALGRFLAASWVVPMLFFPREVLPYVAVVLVLAFAALDPLDGWLRPWQRLGLAFLEALIMLPTAGFAFVTDELAWFAVPRVALFLYSVAILAFKARLLRDGEWPRTADASPGGARAA